MLCDSCNSAVSEDSIFCLSCGALQKAAHEQVIRAFAQELMEKGTSAYQKKDLQDAITQFTNILKILPDEREARRMLLAAEEEYKAIRETLNKAHALLTDHQYAEAQTQARNILSLHPGQPEAVRILEEATSSISSLEESLVRGKECLQSNRYEEALENFRAALELDPRSSQIQNFIASAQSRLTAWDQQMEQVRKLRNAHSFDDAILFAEEMTEKRPFDTKLQNLLHEIKSTRETLIRSRLAGKEALSQNRWADAVRAWGKVVSILPEDTQARENRDLALAQAAKQRAVRIRTAIKISVAAVVVVIVLVLAFTALTNRSHLQSGKEALSSGEPERALEEFEQTGTFFIPTEELKQLKRDATYLLHLKRGDSAREKQDLAQADAEYRAALRFAADPEEVNKRLEILRVLETLQASKAFAKDRDYSKAVSTAREASSKLVALGNFSGANLLRNRATDAINSFLALWLESARRLVSSERYLDAGLQLRQILNEFPANAETQNLLTDCRNAWLKHAENLRKEARWQDAITEYLKMSAPFPSDPEVAKQTQITNTERLLSEARASMEKGKYKEALKAALEADQESQTIPDLRQKVTDLTARITEIVDNKYSTCLAQTHQFMKDGDLESAKTAAEQALSFRETEEAKSLSTEIDDRMKTPEGMVYIPAGSCTIGDSNQVFWKRECPAHTVDLPAYYIDACPVTNAQYLKFVKATGHRMPQHWVKAGNKIPPGKENHPVTYVSLAEATAYAQWANKRLPTESEWEKAARGPDGLIYPWGNTYEKGMANDDKSGLRDTSTVGAFAKGKSPYGCLDMAGNVWEWTSSRIALYPGSEAKLNPEDEKLYVIKGGCFMDDQLYLRSSFRETVDPDSAYALRATLGFRCASDPKR